MFANRYHFLSSPVFQTFAFYRSRCFCVCPGWRWGGKEDGPDFLQFSFLLDQPRVIRVLYFN